MPGTQKDRSLGLTTPLAADTLLLTSFTGREALSEPFRFHLEMIAETDTIAAKSIVGKPVAFRCRMPSGTDRLFHGIVSRFSANSKESDESGLAFFRAEVVPLFWFLHLRTNCRVFQKQSVTEIVDAIFTDHGLTDSHKQLTGTYEKLEYCVQYRETDFNFVSRLLEQAGIYYFFEYAADKHTIVLADAASAYVDCAENEIKFYGNFDNQLEGQITRWEHGFEYTPGSYAQTDYNFETPATSLLATEKTLVDLDNLDKYEIFDYPGLYSAVTDGKAAAKIRIQEREVAFEVVQGSSTCPSLIPGGKFKLTDHPIAGDKNKSFAVISVEHAAHEIADYRAEPLKRERRVRDYENTFRCIPAATVYRPPRVTPKPFVRGPESALVVGPKDKEIDTDKYGCVRVQFYWDRLGTKDEKSSCWLRVTQSLAGANFGAIFTPRIGHEVLVDFLDGDPDRPIVVGSIYNGANLPPYTLPDNQTISGLKTHSTDKGKDTNYNELKFDDNIGKELVNFQAERDFNRLVKNNDTLKVGYDTKDKGNQTIDIYNDRTVTLDKGNDALTITTGNRSVTISAGNDTLTLSKGNRTVTLDKGNYALTVTEGNHEIKVDAGTSSITAAKSLTLTVGSSSIKLEPGGITIQGTQVTIKADLANSISGATVEVKGPGSVTVKRGVINLN